MPNRAVYLSDLEIADIISLRGKDKPVNIAAKYQIGLTRLYKIWTDASGDKKFPGGLTGTQSGKKLTEMAKKLITQRNNLQDEIAKIKLEYVNLQNTITHEHDRIEQKRKTVQALTSKFTLLQQQQQTIEGAIKKIPVDQQRLTELTELQQQQKKKITDLNSIIEDNKKKIPAMEKIIADQRGNNTRLEKINSDADDVEKKLTAAMTNHVFDKKQFNKILSNKSVEQKLSEALLR